MKVSQQSLQEKLITSLCKEGQLYIDKHHLWRIARNFQPNQIFQERFSKQFISLIPNQNGIQIVIKVFQKTLNTLCNLLRDKTQKKKKSIQEKIVFMIFEKMFSEEQKKQLKQGIKKQFNFIQQENKQAQTDDFWNRLILQFLSTIVCEQQQKITQNKQRIEKNDNFFQFDNYISEKL